MGACGGFNPFRDGHGRFADQAGGGSRETLSAPLRGRLEWAKGGVQVEFTGGRAPAYRVLFRGELIKEFPATAKWRQDLAAATAHGEAHLIVLQTAEMNQVVRGLAAGAEPSLAAIGDAVAAAKAIQAGVTTRGEARVAVYEGVGKQIMALVDRNEVVAGLRQKVADLERQMGTLPLGAWPDRLPGDAANARQNLSYAIRDQAGQILEQLRPMAGRHDMNIDPLSLERGMDLADEVAGFFPQAWVHQAAKHVLAVDSTPASRSYYQPSLRAIFLTEEAGRRSMIHEMGHWLEGEVRGLREAAADYRDSRTKGEAALSMRETYGQSYDSTEYTKPDHFESPYMGKQYGSGSTEIISMMAEEYSEGRYGVTLRDPDMLNWYLGVLATI